MTPSISALFVLFQGAALTANSTGHKNVNWGPQCSIEFCSVPSRKTALTTYCDFAPREFQNNVQDWGPYFDVSSTQNCWCSCKSAEHP